MQIVRYFDTFAFVRHPFVRLVSTFKDKILDKNYRHWRELVHFDESDPGRSESVRHCSGRSDSASRAATRPGRARPGRRSLVHREGGSRQLRGRRIRLSDGSRGFGRRSRPGGRIFAAKRRKSRRRYSQATSPGK